MNFVTTSSTMCVHRSSPLAQNSDEEGLSNIVIRSVIFTVRRLNRGEGSQERSKRKKKQGGVGC